MSDLQSSKREVITGSGRSSVLGWLLPSTSDILLLGLLTSLAFGRPQLQLLNDPGIGWHIRTGEWILQNHRIPHVDIFSSIARPWFAWEWLTDIGLASIHHIGGLNGVLVAGAAVIALIFSLLFALTRARGASWFAALAFVVVSALASTIHFLARPHLLTWLLALISWYLLESSVENLRRIYWLPFIALLWANLHGGFLFLFVLTGLSLVGECWSWLTSSDSLVRLHARNRAKKLGAITVFCFAATLVNPYGVSLYTHIFSYLRDPFLMNHIQEFQSPNFHQFAPRCFALLLFVGLVTAILRRERLRTSQIFVLLFVSASAVIAVRNIPLACIVTTVTIAPLAPRTSSAKSIWSRLLAFSARMETTEASLKGHLWPAAALLIAGWACLQSGNLGSSKLVNAQFRPDRFPIDAVQFMGERSATNPVFTTDAWSGYLIYRLWPQLSVVIDDRHDMYGSDYMRNYLKIINGEPGWNSLLVETGARSVLIPAQGPLASLLRISPEWKLIYEDKQAVLFSR